MMAAIQALLDRARKYNEEARALAVSAADLDNERQTIVAAFCELGIGKRKAAAELVKLDCRISISVSGPSAQEEGPEPPLLQQIRQSVEAAAAQPLAGDANAGHAQSDLDDGLEPPAFLDRRPKTARNLGAEPDAPDPPELRR
jgi:hypothetical protein